MKPNDGNGRRLVLTEENNIEIRDYQIPGLQNGEVLIETISTLISAGTELGVQGVHAKPDGRWAGSQERVVEVPDWIDSISQKNDQFLGYSNVGRIIDIADNLREDPTVEIREGDVVLSSGNHASHVIGATGAKPLVKVPDDVAPESAAFGVLGSVALYGVERAGLELGKYVAIIGMGVVGQLTLQLARHTGCEVLVAIDLVDMRLSVAKKNGATHLINPTDDNFRSAAREITDGHGFDVIIEASGALPAIPLAVDLGAIGGRVLLLGSPWNRAVEVDFFDIHLKELTLMGIHQPRCPTQSTAFFPWTQEYNRKQILKMIADGRLDVDGLITHRLSYTDAAEAYRKLRNEKDTSLAIVLEW